MRVDADCHRPLHHLASSSSRWSTGLDRAVSGKGRTLLSGHRPVERSGGGRQVGFKARTSPPAWLWVIPPPLRTLSRPPDETASRRRYTAWLSPEHCPAHVLPSRQAAVCGQFDSRPTVAQVTGLHRTARGGGGRVRCRSGAAPSCAEPRAVAGTTTSCSADSGGCCGREGVCGRRAGSYVANWALPPPAARRATPSRHLGAAVPRRTSELPL